MQSITPVPAGMPSMRRGFTVVEMLVAMVVTLVLIGLSAPLYRAQSRAVSETSGRTDATRSAVFAADAIDQDLRNTGVGVFDGQPLVVRAAVDAITFNANMVTARANDPVAVFFDPDADSTAVGSLSTGTTVTLPNSTVSYPGATYVSDAETISYYAVADSASAPVAGASMYTLRRRVNRLPEEIVARNLMRFSGQPIFRYFKRNADGSLSEIPNAQLPLLHSEPRHGVAADSGVAARIDSVAIVRINLISTYKNPRGGHVVDTLQRSVRLANQGLLQRAQCGEAPLAPGAPTLTQTLLGALPAVSVSWAASVDELNGERDVEMYALYRRVVGTPDWGEPLANVPGSGIATLLYTDGNVVPLTQYQYAISALDCTPAPSALSPVTNILITP
jgi:prepilin-type N-terminal cleavage/methylation domain-containing protein